MFTITLFDSTPSAWSRQIDHWYERLGGATNPTLFPPHFLQSVLPHIGGKGVLVQQGEQQLGVGFLFPRQHNTYTLRYHALLPQLEIDLNALAAQVSAQLAAATVIPYDLQGNLTYSPTHDLVNGIDLGRPSQVEAEAVRTLQATVWGSSPASLYPADIHSVEFGLGTSLVARLADQPVGFLFGLIKFGGYRLPADWAERFQGDLRLESQTMGVLPEHRGARIGYWLKWRQAQQAREQGIGVIHWTVDPLQWPNAVLNFGRLRAIASEFMPNYYSFRNELNRVTASRFGLTWLVRSERVNTPATQRSGLIDVTQQPDLLHINDGWTVLHAAPATAQIAIEIPADWTNLQRHDLNAALQWRAVTDELFGRLIGINPGQYVVTDVGTDGERCYLLAQRADDLLWALLAA
jgi:predicted GNAT superfamily acetyltransferase